MSRLNTLNILKPPWEIKKAELIEIAKSMGVSTSGTKSDLTTAILNG